MPNAMFLVGVGPFQSNTDQPYRVDSQGSLAQVIISIATIGGLDHFEWDGTAFTGAYGIVKKNANDEVIDKTNRWMCLKQFRIQGTFSSVGTEVEVFRICSGTDKLQFFLVCSGTTSKYKWRVKLDGTTIATGVTEYAVGTTFYALRYTTNGSIAILEVDTTEEFSVSETSEIEDSFIALVVDANLQNGQTINFHNMQLTQAGNVTDRPDHQDMTGGILTLNGDLVSNQYGSDTDCTNASGTYTKWNDWESGNADDATTINCELGGSVGREISTMSNPTVTNLNGIQIWSRARAGGVGKTVAWWILIDDGAFNIEVAQSNLGSTTWTNIGSAGFGRAPGEPPALRVPWTQTILHATGVGVRSPGTNSQNDEHTAIMVEWFGMGDDALLAIRAWPQRTPAGVGYTPVRQGSL